MNYQERLARAMATALIMLVFVLLGMLLFTAMNERDEVLPEVVTGR